jgi:anti-sigma regulatory factor (Ser/Thr protein kinase)
MLEHDASGEWVRLLHRGVKVDPSAASEARHAVARSLDACGFTSIREDASIVVSELVANAARYGGGGSLRVTSRAGTLRVEVRDRRRAHLPIVRHPDSDDPTGRGLLLVDALSARWGVEIADDGKVVWAELRNPDQQPNVPASSRP